MSFFLCRQKDKNAKKNSPCSNEHKLLYLAEMVGFEPTCPVKDKTISSRSRYDHFDTSPYIFTRFLPQKNFGINPGKKSKILSFYNRLRRFETKRKPSDEVTKRYFAFESFSLRPLRYISVLNYCSNIIT